MASFVPPQPGSGRVNAHGAGRRPRPRGPRGGPGGGVSQPRPRPQPRPGPSFPQPNNADLMNQGLEAFRNWNQTGQGGGGGGFPGQAAPPQAPPDFFTGYGAQSQTPQLGNIPELGRMGQGGFTGRLPSPQRDFPSPWGEVPALASFGRGFGG